MSPGHKCDRLRWVDVTWPQVRPAAVAGALLVFLYTLSDFGLVAMLRFETLTWGIQQSFAASFDRSQAAILALLLVVIALVVVAAERSARGQVVTSRAKLATREPVGVITRTLALLIVLAPPLVGVVAPLAGLGARLLEAQTLREIDFSRLGLATGATIAVSALAALVALVIALPLAALAARYSGRGVGSLETLGYLPHALPGIVVGLSLVFFSLAVLPPLYQTTAVLVFAYAVLFMPKALGTARSSIEGVSPDLVNVARTLGARPFSAWARVTLPLALPGLGIGALLVAIATMKELPATARVTLPLALPGLGIGALLVAIATMKELPATLLLRPTGVNTLATELWSRTSAGEFAGAAPYAAILVLVAAIPAMILSGVRRTAKEEL